MFQLQIKSYKSGMLLPKHHFFILCKGLNSGRPSYSPNTNSFVISAENREDIDTLFWLTYAAWQGKAFHYYLKGSVIPFIRISDYRQQLTIMLQQLPKSQTPLPQIITTLLQLDESEKNIHQQLKTISSMRKLIFHKFICK